MLQGLTPIEHVYVPRSPFPRCATGRVCDTCSDLTVGSPTEPGKETRYADELFGTGLF